MESKSYRMKEFIDPIDGHSLIVDSSAGMSLGPLPGLEHYKEAIEPVLNIADGLVTSPGQSRVIIGRTRSEAGLLIRSDWTNALRDPDFVLPPGKIEYLSLLDASQAIEMGASALVLYFLLGHQEEIEAYCLKSLVNLAIQSSKMGIPVIVDVHPIGPRVVLRDKAIELGVSYAIEGGADGVSIPLPGNHSLETIIKLSGEIPIWIRPNRLDHIGEELLHALAKDICGLWLNEKVFALTNIQEKLRSFRNLIHQNNDSQRR